MTTINLALKLDLETCIDCGIPYVISDDYKSQRRNDHRAFYCLNGHSMCYPQETEAEKLRKVLAAKEIEATRAANVLKAEREEAIRLARRARAGVCPCCNRTFKALSRHMAMKHKEPA